MSLAPLTVECPYCNELACRLKGKLAETSAGRTRFGCDNAHYFVYPEPPGYRPVLDAKKPEQK